MTTTLPPLNFYVFAIQVKIWYQYVIQHTQHDINKYTIRHAILCMLTTHTMIHYDTQYCNTLRFHKMIPPESTKGSSDPSADSCTFPNSPISQLMDNNILSQQPQHPQHNNNNTSLKTIMDNNNVFRLQRHHRPCFQWLSRKWRNYIHVTWWNSEAYFKKFAKSTKDQALSNSFLDFFMETTY